MKKSPYNLWFIALIVILSLGFFAFVIYQSQFGVILIGDMWFFVQKKTSLLREFFLWNNLNFGSPQAFPPTLYTVMFKLLAYVFPLYMVNHLYYYGTFFLLGLSTIYLVRKINPKASILDYIICTIITVVSPLIYPIVIIGGIEEMYSLAFVNFALGFLFNFKDTTRITWKNVTILSFVLLSLKIGRAHV